MANTMTSTGLVYDERMLEHRCLWEDHPERPERLTSIMDRCTELGLLSRCVNLQPRLATELEIGSLHGPEQYAKLEAVSGTEVDVEDLKELASQYDSVYVHPSTLQAARLACGSTLELVRAIGEGEVQNGMAIVRPPGHHAMAHEYCGYSLFNNVALAAQYALDFGHATRILIVDFDVHHGQGTQQLFYDDPRVFYFSTHRFEYGKFWPNLRESDFNHNGQDKGAGFNCNVPLNAVGMNDTEFLAVWYQILLPIGHQLQPDLVLVSAGFDSALGDPKGHMRLTPACYAHLLAPLLGLAEGRVAVVLEGGYCLRALAEGAAMCLRTLLGDPCPRLPRPIGVPMPEIVDTILNVMTVLQEHWTFPVNKTEEQAKKDAHIATVRFDWIEQPKPDKYPITNPNPVSTFEQEGVARSDAEQELERIIGETDLWVPSHRIGVTPAVETELKKEEGHSYPVTNMLEVTQSVLLGACQLGLCYWNSELYQPACSEISAQLDKALWVTLCGGGTKMAVPAVSVPRDRTLQILVTMNNTSAAPAENNTITKYRVELAADAAGDLLAFCTSVILPIAYEYGPQLVVLRMEVEEVLAEGIKEELRSFIRLLSQLANGKMIIAFAEDDGGACIRTILSLLRRGGKPAKIPMVNYGSERLSSTLNRVAQHWSILQPFRKRINPTAAKVTQICNQ